MQAPHSPSAQPSLTPVRPAWSRSQSSSVDTGGAGRCDDLSVDGGRDRFVDIDVDRVDRVSAGGAGTAQQRRTLGPLGSLPIVGQRTQCPLDHGGQQRAAVVGGGPKIVDRCGGGGRRLHRICDRCVVEPAALQPGAEARNVHHGRGDAAEREYGVGDDLVVEVDDRCEVHDRDRLGSSQAGLHEDASLRVGEGTNRDTGDELVGGQRCRSETRDEVGDRDGATSRRRSDVDICAERQQGRDRVVGRAGRDHVAGDGGAVAELWRPDLQARLCQRQHVITAELALDDLAVRDERSEVHPAVVDLDRVEPVDPAEVDQHLDTWVSTAVEFDQQVGGTGHGPRLGTMLGEQVQGTVECGRRDVPRHQRRSLLDMVQLHQRSSRL